MGLLLGQVSKWRAQRADRGAHAARGFVGGATSLISSIRRSKRMFQCRTRLCGWCSRTECLERRGPMAFQCRTRLCGWCSERGIPSWNSLSIVSMPHAAIPFRPHHRFAVPLPRSRRGGLVTRRFLAESRNISFPRRCGGAVNVCQSHFVLLVFLGRFPIRPVSRSAVPYGLASRTGQ